MFTNRKFDNLVKVIKQSEGGIEKRLDENRELLETIIRESPNLLKDNPCIVHWFQSTEQWIFNVSVAANINIDIKRIRPFPEITPPKTFNIVKVVAQTTKDNSSLIRQLESAIHYLKKGNSKGVEHDDDIGFTFETTIEENSIFGDECAATRFE
ncbi:hypothetical protein EL06_25845 [Salmonella enterica subsp. diarizonae]|uniref:Uncharacterized protein n=1 Tax=Salmonella diarizonae TaxID=59204 RepID=A0A6C8Y438_SALDZ|nr:hypothetical protein [Salmonella enterica subsp. diarizonae]